jgi:ABC-type sugar transport system ATPase subunit
VTRHLSDDRRVGGATRGEPVVECVGLQKTFGGVRALRGVSVAFYPGEVTALVGDNGAGKSTLVKILGGMYSPDDGEVIVDKHRTQRLTPRESAHHGIEIVYQDLALCDNLPAGPNILLGREPVLRWGVPGFKFLDRRKATLIGREQVSVLGANIPDWNTPVRELSGGQRQALALARATISGHRMIVLDEPTAALGVQQTMAMLRLVRNVADHGVAVLLIMHNLDQIFEVSDRLVVLRLGEISLDARRADTSKEEVIAHIMGATGRPEAHGEPNDIVE